VQVWEGKNAVLTGRKMIGATNPQVSEHVAARISEDGFGCCAPRLLLADLPRKHLYGKLARDMHCPQLTCRHGADCMQLNGFVLCMPSVAHADSKVLLWS
jgi:hypothetical protein